MGGFEGGDEGGFWDEESLFNPINTKISNKTNQLHKYTTFKESNAIFELYFVPCEAQALTIECETESLYDFGDIYSIYTRVLEYTNDSEIEEFFSTHKVLFSKVENPKEPHEILMPSELFLQKTKDAGSLVLTQDELKDLSAMR